MMRIVTDRGQLFQNANGQAVIRWNRGARQMNENFDRLQVFVDNTVVRHMDAYVPMRTGMLKKSVILGSRMGSGELVFIAPYAHKRYYSGNIGYWLQGVEYVSEIGRASCRERV